MAQFGRALRSGRRGRRFKSCHFDYLAGAPEAFEIELSVFFVYLGNLLNKRFLFVFGMQEFRDVSIKQKRFAEIRSDVSGISMKVFCDNGKILPENSTKWAERKGSLLRNKQKNYKRFLKNSPTSQ